MTKKQKRVIDKSVFDRVAVYIDAAFACYVNGKSQSGVSTMLGNTSVNEISRTKDITEAELVALSDHVMEADLMTEFLKEQGIRMKTPIVYQDNASTVTLVTKGGGKPRTKYLRVRQMLVKQMIELKQIEVQFIRTGKMVADVLTKPLNGGPFHKLVKVLLGWVDMTKWQQPSHKTTGVR
jgi:arsenate reductase-like glutaredoxin family protein